MNHQKVWETISNTWKAQSWAQVEVSQTIEQITWKVSGLLSVDLQRSMAENNEAFLDLLWKLKNEVARKSEEIGMIMIEKII